MRVAVFASALTALLTGCVGDGAGPQSEVSTSETIEDVGYYYACGNEVLQLPDGRRFYPFIDQGEIDEADYLGVTTSPAVAPLLVATALAVPNPGPGDDTGTLTIYEDGTARYVSESGTEAWLTDEEQTYDWVC